MIDKNLSFVYEFDDEALIFENGKDIGLVRGERLLKIIELINTACSKYGIDFECLEECLDDFDDFLENEYNHGLYGYTYNGEEEEI